MCCLAFTGAAAAMPAPTAVYAEDLVYNGMKYTVSDNRVTITGFTRDIPAELVIPEKIDGMQVFMIGNQAFKECTKLKKVSVQSNLVLDGEYAFWDCVNLVEIKLPSSVHDLGGGAFWGCKSLRRISIPATVLCIRRLLFESCESLTEITIPAGVSSIDIRAFRDCKNLKEITIPASVTRIEDDAFEGCVNLTFFGAKGSAAENYAMDYDNISFQKLRGDLDNSVTITAEDAQLALIAYLKKLSTGSAGLSKAEFTIADVDENGILNADDAQHILIYATHILAGLNPKWDDIIIF